MILRRSRSKRTVTANGEWTLEEPDFTLPLAQGNWDGVKPKYKLSDVSGISPSQDFSSY